MLLEREILRSRALLSWSQGLCTVPLKSQICLAGFLGIVHAHMIDGPPRENTSEWFMAERARIDLSWAH
jgi:hypothetical protein